MIDSDTDDDGDAPNSPLAFPLTQHLETIAAADEREESVASPSLFDDIDDDPLPAPPLCFYKDSQSQQGPDFENNHF